MSDASTRSTRTTVAKLLLVAAGMFGFGYALVPAYRVFCDITGLNGRLDDAPSAAQASGVDRDRTVTVEFVATVNGQAPWDFRPTVTRMEVHPGEIYTTEFLATNRLEEALTGQASYNVAPGEAARYFRKPDCFCFTQQPFGEGEQRSLPVTFFIEPDLPKSVHTVTLSYTLFDITEEG